MSGKALIMPTLLLQTLWRNTKGEKGGALHFPKVNEHFVSNIQVKSMAFTTQPILRCAHMHTDTHAHTRPHTHTHTHQNAPHHPPTHTPTHNKNTPPHTHTHPQTHTHTHHTHSERESK